MKRPLALIVAGVLSIALAVCVAWRAMSASHRDDVVELPKPAVALPEPEVPALVDATSTQPVAEVEQREVAVIPAPVDDGSALEFTVVDGRSGEPVADAEVRWIALAAQEPVEFDPVDFLESVRDMWNPDLSELEERVRASGLVTRTTADGRARIQAALDGVLVRKGNLLGGYDSLYDDDKRLTMHLWPDGDLRVRAVDATGKAISGIGVLLVSKYADWGSDSVAVRAVADGDGFASLRHACVTIASQDARSPQMRSQWRLALDTVPSTLASQSLDADVLPHEPTTLQAPDLGEVQLFVNELDGHAAEVELPVVLAEVDNNNTHTDGSQDWTPPLGDPRTPGYVSAAIVGGRAVFHHVGLDRQLIAFVGRNSSSDVVAVRFRGPTAAQRSVRAEVVLGATTVLLTGRVLDSDGAPVSNTRLRIELFSQPSEERIQFINAGRDDTMTAAQSNFTTRDDGRFTIEYSIDHAYGGRPLSVLTLKRRDGPTLAASIDLSSVWSAGSHALGDVRLVAAPVLAAGVIVDNAGAPLAGVDIGIDSSEGGMHYPREVVATQTDARGEFELRSAHPQTSVSLSADHKAFAPFRSDGAPGRTDWRIVLQGACKVVARVRLPPNSAKDAFGISVSRTDVENKDGIGNSYSTLNEDGSFEQTQLPPGTYALAVYPGGDYHNEVARIAGVVLRAGETTDAGVIDLASSSRAVTVHIVGPDDVPVRSGRYAFGADGTKLIDELWTGFPGKELHGNELHLAREGARLDVAIAAPELRIELFSDVHDGDVLHMERALPVTIALSNSVSAPPAGVSFGVALIRADLDHHWMLLTRVDWYRAAFDARGEATVPAPGPGRFVVRWILSQGTPGGGASRYWQEPPQYIEVADTSAPQRFELVCPIDPATDWDKK